MKTSGKTTRACNQVRHALFPCPPAPSRLSQRSLQNTEEASVPAQSHPSIYWQNPCIPFPTSQFASKQETVISPFPLPARYPPPPSTGYPTSGPHNVTPNTHHNHVPSDLPPGIPKRDLVLAILFSSSSSVSVIVKPGARYLHTSAVCQLQQLTSHIHQSINQ